jgi:hypothetical protein
MKKTICQFAWNAGLAALETLWDKGSSERNFNLTYILQADGLKLMAHQQRQRENKKETIFLWEAENSCRPRQSKQSFADTPAGRRHAGSCCGSLAQGP